MSTGPPSSRSGELGSTCSPCGSWPKASRRPAAHNRRRLRFAPMAYLRPPTVALKHNSGPAFSTAVPTPIARLLAWLCMPTGRQNVRICRRSGDHQSLWLPRRPGRTTLWQPSGSACRSRTVTVSMSRNVTARTPGAGHAGSADMRASGLVEGRPLGKPDGTLWRCGGIVNASWPACRRRSPIPRIARLYRDPSIGTTRCRRAAADMLAGWAAR